MDKFQQEWAKRRASDGRRMTATSEDFAAKTIISSQQPTQKAEKFHQARCSHWYQQRALKAKFHCFNLAFYALVGLQTTVHSAYTHSSLYRRIIGLL